jgi:hypothetical protein
MEIVNCPKDKRRYRATDRFFREKKMESAVEWFEKEIKKEAVRIDNKESYIRLQDVMALVERAFGDMQP